ncbi:MAG: hypothetical protein IKE58_08970 [Blautia sp.]|nr:hypothetical protein [Blautia sp.]
MRVLFRDNLPLAEFVLRIITGKNDLRLTQEETQKDMSRLVGARGICLDVHGVDDQNRQYDLEVQRADSGARPERAMYLKTDPKGVALMCKAMEDLREESINRGKEAAILMSIKNLMTTLKLTKQQAMDALLIPLAEQSKYLAKL